MILRKQFLRDEELSGIESEKSFTVREDDPVSVHYFQQISGGSGKQFFSSPWGGCVLKNCDDSGELLEFSTMSDYEKFMKNSRKRQWIYLKLKVFRVNGVGMRLFGVFVCPECECMSSLAGLEASQAPEDIKQKLCLHSLVASMMIVDWRHFWEITMSVNDEMYDVLCNEDDKFATFIHQTTDTALLACVIDKKNISLLYCSTSRQEVPFCSSCVRRKCYHYRQLVAFNSSQAGENLEENDNLEEELGDYEPRHDEEEEDYGDHYMRKLPMHTRGFLYGYNFTAIEYPFCEASDQQRVWMERRIGKVELPDSLIPNFSQEIKCKHEVLYNNCDDSLVRESQNVCLNNDVGERIFPTAVFVRPTVGPCNCLQRFDGHPLLLWNLGKGRFVDYTMLLGYLHKWIASGISIHALYQSIVSCAESCGLSCSLTYSDLHRSVCGFFGNLVFDHSKAFSCPKHGTSPKFIVSDGKALGPLKSRCKHLSELDFAEEDKSVLKQSTHHKNRIFLNVKKERSIVVRLLTCDISMEEFSVNRELKTENGLMVRNLVAYLKEKYPDEIPIPFATFLGNISKNSSARSLIQVNKLDVLEYLSEYCKEELDLRIIQNEEKLKAVIKSLPALWPTLDAICSIEKSKFLPREVSRIVLRILKIRHDTFEESTERSNTEYYLWKNAIHEHPTQCYPTLPLWRHPSRYRVTDQTDSDLCDKSFSYHSDFIAGFYSVGCACEFNITFGFEIMLLKESPRNLFRFLMTRDVDLGALQGILVDHACIFEPYVMNREADLLKNKLVLVDGAHWQGMKKLKRFDKSGKGGHIG